MPAAVVNGIRIHYRLTGDGAVPLALVHGAWVSHRSWELVEPRLARSYRVLWYDRRGHSASERPVVPSTIRDDVADLAALLEHLDLAPAWVGGVSSGASIVLRLAAERPDLLRGIFVHEPALFSLMARDPEGAALLEEFRARGRAVVEMVLAGDAAGAAKTFMETIAEGPGSWDRLAPDYREVLIENAPTWVEDANDPFALDFDLDWLAHFARPVLLTRGESSPPAFGRVLDTVAGALPEAEVRVLRGSGHIPHRTEPEAFARVVDEFIRQNHSRAR